MNYLVDTHILLWSLNDDPKLTPSIRSILSDDDNRMYVSIISFWEISIKHKLGKLNIRADYNERILALRVTLLPLIVPHIKMHDTLERHHRDPFDRMLVAQAKSEGITLITHDKTLAKYGIKTIAA